MFKLFRLIKAIKATYTGTDLLYKSDEAYLAQAVDIYDVERRMQELETRGYRYAPSRVRTFGALADHWCQRC